MKDILLNLLFIIVVLLITQLFLDSRGRNFSSQKEKAVIYLSNLISIIFCMTFSIIVDEDFRYDLRAIPLILGGFLGGSLVSIGLFLSLILYRFTLGFDAGFWGNVLNYGLITILLILLSPRFKKAGTKERILLATSLVIVHIISSYIIYNFLFCPNLPTYLFIHSSFIKLFSSAFIVLFAEGVFWQRRLRDQSDKLEKMELVSHLSASISHEVRNGLTGAYGFLQLLQEQETESLKRKYICLALDELRRTENIIRDFLTFAKPAPREVKRIHLDQLLNSSIALIEPLTNMNSIEIRKSLAPLSINGDESLIQQAFINIFKNAIEAMPKGGVLDIKLTATEKMNMIIISDTGHGMNKEQLARMGTPYYTTKGQKGTGLGMMVTYRVIHELRGKIQVHSQVGQGTTFRIYLPKI